MKPYLRPFAVLIPSVVGLCLSSFCLSGVVWAASPSEQANAQKAKTAAPAAAQELVTIPGPLRSFMRMAAISQKASLDDVLPLLSRNVFMQGYQQGNPTEYLVLLYRYVEQARELQVLAGSKGTIRVNNCDDAGTLVQILGYRIREGCGQKTFYLETANPERAFLTIDSGFPLTELELALQEGKPFTYSYPTTAVPVMFRESDWTVLSPAKKRTVGNLIEVLVNNPDIARLYWGLAKNDVATRTALHQAPGLKALLPFGSTLDFYGGEISIRSGHVIVPGAGTPSRAGKNWWAQVPDLRQSSLATCSRPTRAGWLCTSMFCRV